MTLDLEAEQALVARLRRRDEAAFNLFVRASCVGCGMCAEVCPRGVLSLEQRWPGGAAKRATGLVQLRLRKW